MKHDLSLYLIADIDAAHRYPFLKVVEEAILGGVTVVQLRVKNKTKEEFLRAAQTMRSVTRSYGIPFIINDDVEITLAVNADGVHLGQGDMNISEARKILGSDAIIGVSTHNITEALEAEKIGANYAGVGTVFPTTSKTDIRGIIGISGLMKIRRKTKLPLIAIGGISLSNTASVIETGVDGIAVISAIMSSLDPKKTAQEFKSIIERHNLKGII
jgi:thiamine-phosphate pyrophosphorylase